MTQRDPITPAELQLDSLISDPAVILDLLSEHTAKAIVLVESFASVNHPIVRDYFRYAGFDAEHVDFVERLVPRSRGGLLVGAMSESRWEKLMDVIRERQGDDVFERTSERVRQILSEDAADESSARTA